MVEAVVKKEYIKLNISVVLRHIKRLFKSKKPKRKYKYHELISEDEQKCVKKISFCIFWLCFMFIWRCFSGG